LYVSVESVAKTAIDGLARGRLVAIPGLVNRAASVLSQVTPRSLLLPILRRQHPGMKN
jgi:short-subunit dehydrogenase